MSAARRLGWSLPGDLLRKEVAEFCVFWWISEEERLSLLLGIALESSVPLPGELSLFSPLFSSLLLPFQALISPPFLL